MNYRAYLLIGTIATGVIAGALFLIAGALFLIRERTKGSLRTLLKSWEFRVSVLALCGIVLCETAYLAARILLPRTADGVSVTVVQCATVQPAQPYTDFACQGTTIFHRTFTDEATVSAVHATLLDGLYEVNPWFNNINCNGGDLCAPRRIYSFDLLWHGHVVQSYVTSNSPLIWSVSTLGLELLATDGSTTRLELGAPAGPTTWQDLVRLTGMPVAPNGVP